MTKSHDIKSYGGHPQEGSKQVIGFDHASVSDLQSPDAVLTISHNRELRVIKVPSWLPSARASAIGDVAVAMGSYTFACSSKPGWRRRVGSMDTANGVTNPRSHIMGEVAHLSSRERHHRFKNATWTADRNSLARTLQQLDAQRRRCLNGYLFDCDENIQIVKDDPWLVELWETIKKLKEMAANHGMVHQGLDLSYVGAYDIWFASFDENSKRLRRPPPSQEEFSKLVKRFLASRSYPEFEGVSTRYPERRQLALSICGWKFDERRLREKCGDIISRKEYYKAIVVAVAHGRKDMAIDILRSLTRTKAIESSGLAAVIACTVISEEQRSLCGWMAEEAEDPYLKALLAYFIAGNWRSVVDMTELPLQYRLAVALKYLDDDGLTRFLSETLTDVVAAGDTEGILLTGLTEHAMDLFQNYIAVFNDLQTAVLAMAFTNPTLISDSICWEAWTTTYFDQLQAWSAFLERSKFMNHHNAMSRNEGQASSASTPTVHSTGESMSLRCLQCEKPIVRRKGTAHLADSLFPSERAKRLAAVEGTQCQRCGRHFSRCVICMHWQGDSRLRQPAPSDDSLDAGFMVKLIGFCTRCKHSFHVHHAKQWFSKHSKCPSPGCPCSCNSHDQRQLRANS